MSNGLDLTLSRFKDIHDQNIYLFNLISKLEYLILHSFSQRKTFKRRYVHVMKKLRRRLRNEGIDLSHFSDLLKPDQTPLEPMVTQIPNK